MDISKTKANLGKAIVHAKAARQEIEGAIQGGYLPKADDLHALKDLVLILGNDVASADSFLGSYQRIGFSSERFVAIVTKK